EAGASLLRLVFFLAAAFAAVHRHQLAAFHVEGFALPDHPAVMAVAAQRGAIAAHRSFERKYVGHKASSASARTGVPIARESLYHNAAFHRRPRGPNVSGPSM